MWKLGSLCRKGHRGNISLLSLARCRHSDPHDFVFPRFFPSDCGSALLFWELTIGRCADQVRHTLCIHHLCFGPKVCVSSIHSKHFVCPAGLSAKSGNRPKSAFATSTREGKGPTEIVSCGAAIHRKSTTVGQHVEFFEQSSTSFDWSGHVFKRQNPKTFKELKR